MPRTGRYPYQQYQFTETVVLAANRGTVDFGNKLREMSRSTLLRVSMAFHTPIMRVIHDELEAYVAAIPFYSPQIPVISNTTRAPYPEDPAAIRRILMSHLESPVHWQDNVETLWRDYGARLFMEVGPGEALSNLIEDTLPEPECIQSCLPAAEGSTWKTALAQLFVQGHLQVAGGRGGFPRAGEKHPKPPIARQAWDRRPLPVVSPPVVGISWSG
jgi:acyl transferase domain-containing protein